MLRIVIFCVIFTCVLAITSKLDDEDTSCPEEDDCLEEIENQTEEATDTKQKTKKEKPNLKLGNEFLESFFDDDGDVIGLDYRTWRIDRKLLFPILAAIAFKGLALIPLALTKLTVIGSIAILTAKLSLLLSTIIFLKTFLSKGKSGGFSSLDPLGFHSGSTNRKTFIVG